jgi:hypothetical protein
MNAAVARAWPPLLAMIQVQLVLLLLLFVPLLVLPLVLTGRCVVAALHGPLWGLQRPPGTAPAHAVVRSSTLRLCSKQQGRFTI